MSFVQAKSFLKSKHYLLSTPNVVSLGFIDEKFDGRKTGRKIFRVGVTKKKSKENIKDPDIFVPKFFEYTKSHSNEVVHIPVKIVEEGVLELLISDGKADPVKNAPRKGASLIRSAPLEDAGCLEADVQHQGSYQLLSTPYVLTRYDHGQGGNEILTQNNEEEYVNTATGVTGQADVVLYKTPTENDPFFTKQGLVSINATEYEGSPKLKDIGTQTRIRRVRKGERGYFEDIGRNVEVEDIAASTILKVSLPDGIKYAYFTDVCRVNPEELPLNNGDSDSAIVAEDENALLGILIAKSNSSTYYFCNLKV